MVLQRHWSLVKCSVHQISILSKMAEDFLEKIDKIRQRLLQLFLTKGRSEPLVQFPEQFV